MMFLILDKNPVSCVQYLLEHTNEKYVSKQVLELMQLICSAGYSKVYKALKWGKEIQNWIRKDHVNQMYIWFYLDYVFYLNILRIKPETKRKYLQIYQDFSSSVMNDLADPHILKDAVFRYRIEYIDTEYETNTLLPIDIAVKEYRKYLDWKLKFQPEILKIKKWSNKDKATKKNN